MENEWKSIPGNEFKKQHAEGFTNMVFAEKPVEKGMEGNYDLKDAFLGHEKVYARCYFPERVGMVRGEDFWHELWVDGKLLKRTFFKQPPEPDWDEIQIWVTEDEYSGEMKSLSPGTHEITLWVMKNVFSGKKEVIEEAADGSIVKKEQDVWIPKRLSRGKFIYDV